MNAFRNLISIENDLISARRAGDAAAIRAFSIEHAEKRLAIELSLEGLRIFSPGEGRRPARSNRQLLIPPPTHQPTKEPSWPTSSANKPPARPPL